MADALFVALLAVVLIAVLLVGSIVGEHNEARRMSDQRRLVRELRRHPQPDQTNGDHHADAVRVVRRTDRR